MSKEVLTGAVFAALLAGSAMAAAPHIATARPPAPDWIVTPTDDACHTDIDLVGRSGATVQVELISDGERISLAFQQDGPADRAFVPIRIDQKPYSNLVQRGADGKTGLMLLGDETLAALKRGSILSVAWLGEEPMSAALTGSERALADLKICGAQAAGQYRGRMAAQRDAQARAELDARAKAVADEQLATAKAQTATAEAERARIAAEADRQQAAADAERQRAAMEAQRLQSQAEAQERQRALAVYQQQQAQAAVYDDNSGWGMPAQDYDPPRYRYRRYDPYGQ